MDLDLAINQAIDETLLSSDPLNIRDEKFPQQDRFVVDKSPFLAALCTRRAGKTNGLALRFIRTMKKHPNSLSRYIALTRDSAKDIMWGVLQEMDYRFNLNATFTEGNLTMTLPNKAKLRLLGADMKNFIRRLKGAKSPAVGIDEAQEFGPHLESLVDDVITPTLADYEDSWLALTGTPGPFPRGMFYDLTETGNGGYSVHKWDLYQNPYMPDPRGFVEKLKTRKKWDDRNPTYLREYKGIWVLDADSLLVRYNETLNHYDELPKLPWIYILGVDIGHKDADALAVLAWSEASPNIYLVEEEITKGQDITQLSNQITRLMQKYNISKIVMDEGALGKKIAEEIRRRKQIPVQPAEKSRKMENVAFLNDWLRQGRFFAQRGSQFVKDSYQLQIDHDKSTPDRLVVKSGFHSDIIDSVLYAFKESPAFSFRQEKPKPKYQSPEWHKQEVDDMEQAAEEHFRQLEEQLNGV